MNKPKTSKIRTKVERQEKDELATASTSKVEKLFIEHFHGRFAGGRFSELANYSDLFLRTEDPIFLVHRHSGIVLECNPAAWRELGLKEDEIVGEKISIFTKNATLDLEVFLNTKLKKIEQDCHFTKSGGSDVVLELSINTLKLKDFDEIVQVIGRNVTEIRAAKNKLTELNQALKKLSITDEMTGLYNYRNFKESLFQYHPEAVENAESYAILFIDVDHFKKYNDRNGHPAGDQVLKTVAKILQSCAREESYPARYGGEEFVILAKRMDKSQASLLAEKIRCEIASTEFPHGGHQPMGKVTVSIGVAGYPSDGNTAQEILKHADEAVYASKQAGRNQVTVYSLDGESKIINAPKKAA